MFSNLTGVSSRQPRQERFRASTTSRWLSASARRALLLEYEDADLPSPVLSAHRLADIGASMLLYPRGDVEALAALAREHDFFVFSDAEYENLVLDGRTYHSIGALPGMAARTITAFSFSKAYCLSGPRIAYAVGPAAGLDRLYNARRVFADRARVSVVSGHQFGRSGRSYLRISGCVGRQRLVEGLDRIERALARLSVRAGAS